MRDADRYFGQWCDYRSTSRWTSTVRRRRVNCASRVVVLTGWCRCACVVSNSGSADCTAGQFGHGESMWTQVLAGSRSILPMLVITAACEPMGGGWLSRTAGRPAAC